MIFGLFFIISLGWTVILTLTGTTTSPFNYGYNLLIGLLFGAGGVIGLLGTRSLASSSRLGKSLFFLSLGNLFQMFGFVTWWYLNTFSHIDIPYPSIADILFVLVYPCMGYGLWLLVKIFNEGITKRNLLESVAIGLIAAVIIIGFVNRPDVSKSLDFYTNLFNILYPLGSVLLLSIALVSYRIGEGKIRPVLELYVIALTLYTAADSVFSYLESTNNYWNGNVADMLFAWAGIIMSLGILSFIETFAPKQELVPGKK